MRCGTLAGHVLRDPAPGLGGGGGGAGGPRRLARIARPAPPLDPESAAALFADEFEGDRIGELWLAADGATEAIRTLPKPVETVVNTPSHHRVHHARNARYLDSNYAGILIVWDRLFGTFEAEDAAEPPRYGLVHDLGDFNLLRAAFHEWHGVGRDLARAKSWRERAGYLSGPPGWSPDGSRDTSETLKARWRARRESSLPQERQAQP